MAYRPTAFHRGIASDVSLTFPTKHAVRSAAIAGRKVSRASVARAGGMGARRAAPMGRPPQNRSGCVEYCTSAPGWTCCWNKTVGAYCCPRGHVIRLQPQATPAAWAGAPGQTPYGGECGVGCMQECSKKHCSQPNPDADGYCGTSSFKKYVHCAAGCIAYKCSPSGGGAGAWLANAEQSGRAAAQEIPIGEGECEENCIKSCNTKCKDKHPDDQNAYVICVSGCIRAVDEGESAPAPRPWGPAPPQPGVPPPRPGSPSKAALRMAAQTGAKVSSASFMGLGAYVPLRQDWAYGEPHAGRFQRGLGATRLTRTRRRRGGIG